MVINPEVILNINDGSVIVTGTPQGEYNYEWHITGLAKDDDDQFADKYILSPTGRNIYVVCNVPIDKTGTFKICNDGYTNQYGIGYYDEEINDSNLSAYLAPRPVDIWGMPFDLHGTYDITWNLAEEYVSFSHSIVPPVAPVEVSIVINTHNGPGITTTVPVNSIVTPKFDIDRYWKISKATLNGQEIKIADNRIGILVNEDKILEVEIEYNGSLEWIEGPTGVAQLQGSDITITVDNDSIIMKGLSTGDEIAIYNTVGQLVERYTSQNNASIRLEPGIYIVRVNDFAIKVIIR